MATSVSGRVEMNQENSDVYEDFYLQHIDAKDEAAGQQQNTQYTSAQHQTEEMYYRSLHEHLPKLDPIKPSEVSFLRKRTMNEENTGNVNGQSTQQEQGSTRMKRQR